MQFRDLERQYKELKPQIDSVIEAVLSKAEFIGGTKVRELEELLETFLGVKHCITCANGTDALQIALLAMGVTCGDAVFVPDFTFFSSGEVVPLVGGTPIFVDVDSRTYNISIEALEKMINLVIKEGKLVPKVIIAVDLFGQPAEHYAIREVAKKYGMYVLEDGAQGFGGKIGEKKACSFGDISTTSFFPAKPLGCYGDGGAIFTDRDDWNDIIRSLCVHGKGNNKYDNTRIGFNSRLDTIQAAILQIKLKSYQEYEFDRVNRVAEWYSSALQEVDRILNLPMVLPGYYSSWAQYTITFCEDNVREHIQKELHKFDVPSMVYYIKPMHKQLAFNGIVESYYLNDDLFANTVQLCKRVLSLPMHPYMEKSEVEFVCDKIKSSLKIACN